MRKSRKTKYVALSMAMLLAVSLFSGCQKESQKLVPPIKIENSEQIRQIQLHTMKSDVEDFSSEKLEELIKDLENTTPLEEETVQSMTIPDDFLSILLIKEDGTKDIFSCFTENEKWYMEHNKNFYSDADFIKKYITILTNSEDEDALVEVHFPMELARKYLELAEDFEQLDVKNAFLFEVEQKLHQGHTKEEAILEAKDSLVKGWKTYKVAKDMGITISGEQLSTLLDQYREEMAKADNFKDYKPLLDEFDTSLEEIIQKSKGYFVYTYMSNELYHLKFKEFALGEDTMNGTIYDSLKEYYRAFLTENVYSYELTDEESKEFLEEVRKAEEGYSTL